MWWITGLEYCNLVVNADRIRMVLLSFVQKNEIHLTQVKGFLINRMEKDLEESDDPDEKNGIRKRIRDKFKTIAGETKAIKEGIMYLQYHCLNPQIYWYFVYSIFPVKESIPA